MKTVGREIGCFDFLCLMVHMGYMRGRGWRGVVRPGGKCVKEKGGRGV